VQTLNNHAQSDPENGHVPVIKEQVSSKSGNEAADKIANGSELQATNIPVATQSTPKSSWFGEFWQWTGFSERTLFDWLQIISSIAVPVILGILSYQLSAQQAKTAEESQRSALVTEYYDQMQKLLIDEKLRGTAVDSEVRSMGRAMTLSTARQLDGERKGDLLKFLYESRLIGGQCKYDAKQIRYNQCQNAIIDLKGAKLGSTIIDSNNTLPLAGIDLRGASLPEAKLSKVVLNSALMNRVILKDTDLSEALLADAQLQDALLEGANLTNAKLQRANLQRANLTNANLTGADLSKADLTGADLTGAILKGAKLQGAIYDSKTKLPGFNPSPAFNPAQAGMLLK
jgi:uncharacterized protein YjbI with pentapeptide repeats